MRRTHAPDLAPPAVWRLLEGLVTWRPVWGSARVIDPERAIGNIAGTAPREVSRLEEFNLAFLDLAEDEQAVILAAVILAQEAWLEGKHWRRFFMLLNIGPRQYELLLAAALRRLTQATARRGLIHGRA